MIGGISVKKFIKRISLLLLCALLAGLFLYKEPPSPDAGVTTLQLSRSTGALFPDHRDTFTGILQSRGEQADYFASLPLETMDRDALEAALADCDYETTTAVLGFFREGASYHPEWYRLTEFKQRENSPDYRFILTCAPPKNYGGSNCVLTAYCSILLLPKMDFGEGKVTVHVRWRAPAQ